ncbi:hypothetical protein ACIBEJ_24220 [Nonomuraea sp. NPDC050790]|uniref:hypothetical protein n=1 Tax=Nonomuraea sp. NPDC050790 TaxID=3364371 RepID=UPI003798E36C
MHDDTPSARQSRRATTASFVGTALEWYDFFIYGTAAALGVGASALGISAAYFTNTFLVAWATTGLGVPRQPLLITVALALSVVTGASYFALLAGFLAQVFPVRVRYTGISVSYQLCGTIIGGSTPLIAQWLLTAGGGGHWPVVGHYVALLVLTLGCVLALARRTTPERHRAERPAALVSS